MNGNKLIQALSTLNKEEWISYRKYLLMYTSEASDNYKVFAYLQKRKTKLTELDEIEDIKQKHFKSLSTKSILNILSKLYLWLEEWLVYYSIKKDKMESNLILVKQLNRRGMYNLADQKAKQLQKQLDNEKGLSVNKSRIQSDLYYYQYYSDNPVKSKKDILRQLANALLEFHSAEKILVYNELINIDRRTKKYETVIKQYNPYLEVAVNTSLNRNLLSLNRLIKNDSVEDFYQLKDALLNRRFESQSDLEVLICMYLFSWVFDLIAQNKIEDNKSTFELVNYGLKYKLLTAGNNLDAIRYINLVNSMSRTIDEDGIIKFINQWASTIPDEITESMEVISLALYYIVKNKYDYIPIQPKLLFFKNTHLKLVSISIYIITNFKEKKENYNIIIEASAILKRMLFRYKNHITRERYLGYINFTKVTKSLINNKPIELKSYLPIMHQPWIMHQLNKVNQ